MLKSSTNQAEQEGERKRLSSSTLSVFVSLLYVELGNGQNSHLDAHIYRPFSKSYCPIYLLDAKHIKQAVLALRDIFLSCP
jgi:hypothetical protein